MSDDFLSSACPSVPAGLRETVMGRLSALRASELEDSRPLGPKVKAAGLNRRQRILAIFALILLLAACTAGVLRIGRLAFDETEKLPTKIPNVMAVPQRVVPLDELWGGVAFEFGLPRWTPDEFVLSDQAMVTLPEETSPIQEAWQVWFYWRIPGDTMRREIVLMAYPSEYEKSYPVPVVPGSVEAVDIAGEEGAVVHGNWIGDRWEESLGGNVRWIHGETGYWLQSAWVPVEDLVRMASSIQ